MDFQDTSSQIHNIPCELITIILENTDTKDIINFGSTCKKFHELVFSNDYLWKKKYSEIVPNAMFKIICERGDGNWLKEISHFYKLKQDVCSQLLTMSPEYFWRTTDLSLKDVRPFFTYATANSRNYYYTIQILQDIIKKGYAMVDTQDCPNPLYNLTAIFYAKIVLQHLMHTYLAMKWVEKYLIFDLKPPFVTNFFLQWVDVTKTYNDEDVADKIESLVKMVDEDLNEVEKSCRGKLTERQILESVSKIIYNNAKVSRTHSTATLDIAKVIKSKSGSTISYGAIYQEVAINFGLSCELIAFSNHLFLEWKCNDEQYHPLYTIDLCTGEPRPKRRCPFSFDDSKYEYCPDSLLRYTYSAFMKSEGATKNYKTKNALHLWDYFGTIPNEHNPFKNFYLNLVKYANAPAFNKTLNLYYLEDAHFDMIMRIASLEDFPEPNNRILVVKKRHHNIMYAVGMVCYHSVYNYMCVIRGWEVNGNHLRIQGADTLQYGANQPFYSVVAGDQSERLIAQENMKALHKPFRLQNMEDALGREFTHFDGFSYIPNIEKQMEYPDEAPFVEAFKKRMPPPSNADD